MLNTRRTTYHVTCFLPVGLSMPVTRTAKQKDTKKRCNVGPLAASSVWKRVFGCAQLALSDVIPLRPQQHYSR